MHQKSQQGIQKNCVLEFPILSAHQLPSYKLVVFIDMNTYIQKAEISKRSWKKIMQLLQTVVTYLLKKVEHGTEHDIDRVYRVFKH